MVKAHTCLAPACFKAWVAALSVAPVVIISSTIATVLPLISAVHINASFKFLTRLALVSLDCACVFLLRNSESLSKLKDDKHGCHTCVT